MVNFGALAAEIVSLVWIPLQISTGFASWQRCCTAIQYWASTRLAALNRGRRQYSAGRPSRWVLLAHISSFEYFECSPITSDGDEENAGFSLPVGELSLVWNLGTIRGECADEPV